MPISTNFFLPKCRFPPNFYDKRGQLSLLKLPSEVKITTEGSNFYDKRGQLSLLKLPSEVKITTEGSNFYDKRGQLSLLKLPSEVKPTLAARVEDKFIYIIPCKKVIFTNSIIDYMIYKESAQNLKDI